MEKSCFYIIGARLDNRTSNAMKFQERLTELGCNIKARLGLHEAGEGFCAKDGLIILQLCADAQEADKVIDALNGLEGVTAKLLDLN